MQNPGSYQQRIPRPSCQPTLPGRLRSVRPLRSLAGSVTQGPPPAPGELPFLFNITREAVPSKREACRHCPSDEHKCEGPRLPHSW